LNGNCSQVLDFVISQHTESELRQAHERVVEAFRRHRTVSASDDVGWSKSNRGDSATTYVTHEVEHHVAASQETEGGEAALLLWVSDHIQDCITLAAMEQMGAEKLAEAAIQAESDGEYYFAACRWHSAAYKRKTIDGYRDKESARLRLRAVEASQKIEADADGNEANGRCGPKEIELLKFRVVAAFCNSNTLSYLPEAAEQIEPILEQALQSNAATALPIDTFFINWCHGKVVDKMEDGNFIHACSYMIELIGPMFAQAEKTQDPTVLEGCSLLIAGLDVLMDLCLLCDNWEWSQWPMEAITRAVRAYDYDIHHEQMKVTVGMDWSAWQPMGLSVALHRGDIELMQTGCDFHMDSLRRMYQEPDQSQERIYFCANIVGKTTILMTMFCRQDLAAEVYKEVGLDWDGCDEWLDEAATSFGRLRPRGCSGVSRDPNEIVEEVDNAAFCVEGCAFMAKCSYHLPTRVQ
jgi:hypothetical protein